MAMQQQTLAMSVHAYAAHGYVKRKPYEAHISAVCEQQPQLTPLYQGCFRTTCTESSIFSVMTSVQDLQQTYWIRCCEQLLEDQLVHPAINSNNASYCVELEQHICSRA